MFQDVLHDDKVTPDGSSNRGITVKFALTAEPLGREDDSADKRQARDVVDGMNKALEQVGDTSAAVGAITSVVDTTDKVVNDSNTIAKDINTLQTFESLSPILSKWMDLFDRIGSAVAEVFRFESPRPHGLNSYRSTHMRRRLGPFYLRRTRSVSFRVPYYHWSLTIFPKGALEPKRP